MGVLRRTRIVPARFEDNVVPTYDPYHALDDKAIETRHGSPAFVTHDLAAQGFIGDSHYGSAFTQAGSIAGTGYWVYPKPYTRVYGAVASPLNWYNTSYSPGEIERLTPGSCKISGSPSGYTLILVVGDV